MRLITRRAKSVASSQLLVMRRARLRLIQRRSCASCQIRVSYQTSRIAEVRAPASTSNLGPGFDCCGLALKLYLSVTATMPDVSEGQTLPSSLAEKNQTHVGDNLIYDAMRFVAERERVELPPVQLEIQADIPFASGLGSSGAAIAAGITLCSAICDLDLTQ